MGKKHFEVLDGLRGTAALMVVLFHFSEPLLGDPRGNPLGHVFLAVDFFFCLSGFVIGYAYDARPELGVAGFVRTRLLRLHPLVLAGATLGLVSFLVDPFGGAARAADLALAYASVLLLVPYAAGLPDRFDLLFQLNAPAWSLFWEYVASLAYALVLWRLPRRILAVLVLGAAAGLFALAWNAGTVDGGWGLSNWWQGGLRTAYSFCAGLLAWRCRFVLRTRGGYLALSLLLVAGLLAARSWMLELALVLAGFPVLVALGAGATVAGRTGALCRFMGRISYPLYITHNMLIWPFGHFVQRVHPGPLLTAAVVAGGVAVAVGTAYAALRWFDQPLRGRLQNAPWAPAKGGRPARE